MLVLARARGPWAFAIGYAAAELAQGLVFVTLGAVDLSHEARTLSLVVVIIGLAAWLRYEAA